MSSVLRFLKQTPSNTIRTSATTDVYTYAQIETAAAGALFISNSLIQFTSNTALASGITAIETAASATLPANLALKDMGERVYWGVGGAESEQVIFTSVLQQGSVASGVPVYVVLQDNSGVMDVTVSRGAF